MMLEAHLKQEDEMTHDGKRDDTTGERDEPIVLSPEEYERVTAALRLPSPGLQALAAQRDDTTGELVRRVSEMDACVWALRLELHPALHDELKRRWEAVREVT